MRKDYTDYAVHWTKGTVEEAIDKLFSIAIDGKIFGSSFGVRSKECCICFSEAPAEDFHNGGSYFQPFGVKVSKKWLFSEGGRPVIYQPESEYDFLDKCIQWKHVDYNPTGRSARNYTWQREWRIKGESISVPADKAIFLVPNQEFSRGLQRRIADYESARGLASCSPYGYEWIEYSGATNPQEYRIEIFQEPSPGSLVI